MRQGNRWRLILVLTLLIPISGCNTNRQPSRSSLSDNGRFMDLWSTYTHCYRSEDLDAMRADAQRLSRAANTIDSAADPIPHESNEPVHSWPTVRLSVDPSAMAASCTLHAGQAAQGMGRLYVAREMFHMVVTNFPQPRYRYYVAQARRGLESLDAAGHTTFGGADVSGGIRIAIKRNLPSAAQSSVEMVSLSHAADPAPTDSSKTMVVSEQIVRRMSPATGAIFYPKKPYAVLNWPAARLQSSGFGAA